MRPWAHSLMYKVFTETTHGLALFQAAACRYQSGNMTRGIVIPAGGVVLLNHAWATIKVCMARS